MEQNNIDKLFKDKLASEEVEFNPAAWTAAESLIAQQTGASAWYAGKTLIATVITLLLTVGGASWFITTENSNDNNIASTSNNAATEAKANLDVQKTTETAIVEFSQSETLASSRTVAEKQIVQPNVETITELSETKEVANEINTSLAETKNSTSTNRSETAKPSLNDNSAEDVDNSLASKQISTTNSITSRGSISIFETNIIEKEIVAISVVDLLATQELESEEDFSQPVELPINDKGLSILRNFDIRFVLGGGAAWGFRNPQFNDPSKIGYSPTVGFDFGYIVNSGFSFDINVLYRMRTGLSNETLILVTNSNEATVAKSLHYLDVPFYLNYHSNRHSFQLGMQYSYLLTTNTEATNSLDGTTQSVWGKNEYFKNSDLATVLGYSFMLNEQLNVGARFNYGIFDVTGNQSSTWETNDKNIHFNLLLEYKLSKY